ncbi:MAG: Ig-like domain-containing protein [Clostridia bacterium]|nr:Ig-like domain-containing protein [Clostridia bacterium]
MTKNIKSKFIIALTFIFAIAFAIGALGVYNVKATPQTFEMYQGASIRVGEGTDEDPIGIRFIATIASEEYNKLIEDYGEDNVEFGMRIAKCETVEELMLFPDEGCMKPVNAVVENQKEGVRVISIAIKNVSPAYYNTYFTALGYVKVTDTQTSQTQTYYANYTAGENSRTPFQVAVAHKLAVNMSEDDIEAEFINGIIDNVLKQGGAIIQQKEYVLAQNGTVQPFMEVAGVPVKSELKVTDENVAKIENGKLVAVGKGQTTLTATVSGYENTSEKTATVIVKDSALAITYSNGVAKWSGDANKIVIDGVELDLEQGATSFDVAEYLKTNGFEEKVYTVAVKNAEVTSESVSITMKKVDNAEELLAISSGDANTYYVVTDNISLADSAVSVFGTYKAYIESLTGVLDVNGYAIYAINYKETEDVSSYYKGLINKVNSTGVVKNGYFTGTISIKGNGNAFIVGELEGLMESCYISVHGFGVGYPTTGGGSKNYNTAQGIIYDARDGGVLSNVVVDYNKMANKNTLPVVDYALGATVSNVIAIGGTAVKTNSAHFYRSIGANTNSYFAFDKNNTYYYTSVQNVLKQSGTLLKYDGTVSSMVSTSKVPYLGFSSAFDFDKEDGKIYMVNDKYGKMDMSVTLTVENQELDVVKDKYSPKISTMIFGIYGSDELTYTSSNTAVATVSADGTVTYAGNGTTTITVTHKESGATATVSVKTYDTYIGITDLATFVTVEGATQYTYAELLNDIEIKESDLSSYKVSIVWIPYTGNVTASALVNTFGGTLNGNGKKISTVMDKTVTSFTTNIDGTDQTTTNFALLFCNFTSTAVMKNTIIDAYITTHATGANGRTSIMHYSEGVIKDCYIKVFYFGESGLGEHQIIRYCRGTLTNCVIDASGYSGSVDNGLFSIVITTTRVSYLSIEYTLDNIMLVHDKYGDSGYFHSNGAYAGTNVSSYKNYANILTGSGVSYSLDANNALAYTALTAPQYNLFSSAWTFSAQEGIKLCGTAIYTPA